MSRLLDAYDRLTRRQAAAMQGVTDEVRAEGGIKSFDGADILSRTHAAMLSGTDVTADELSEVSDVAARPGVQSALTALPLVEAGVIPVQDFMHGLLRQAIEQGIVIGLEARS